MEREPDHSAHREAHHEEKPRDAGDARILAARRARPAQSGGAFA